MAQSAVGLRCATRQRVRCDALRLSGDRQFDAEMEAAAAGNRVVHRAACQLCHDHWLRALEIWTHSKLPHVRRKVLPMAGAGRSHRDAAGLVDVANASCQYRGDVDQHRGDSNQFCPANLEGRRADTAACASETAESGLMTEFSLPGIEHSWPVSEFVGWDQRSAGPPHRRNGGPALSLVPPYKEYSKTDSQ